MLKISLVIGKIVEKYVLMAMEGGRDCRLLLPGLTPTIAGELQKYLKDHLPAKVSSYLIIGESEQPSELEGKIRAVGLTSKRIGSFVAITSPGQLVHIQDSIRGSGGTIRSIAFSEEWPWIDDVGSESFRFDGPVLEELAKEWSSDHDEQAWLKEFTLKGLLEDTRSSSGSRRTQVLLEQVLGTFHADLYPSIIDIREKFLYHSGIPRPEGQILQVKTLIADSTRLGKRIIERYKKDEDTREQARNKIEEMFAGNDREVITKSLDNFLDGIGKSDTIDLGLLAFHGCWANPSDWKQLNSRLLEELFRVKPNEADIKYKLHCRNGVVSANNKKLATFIGEVFFVEIFFKNIPENQVTSGSWTARLLSRQRNILTPVVLTETQGSVCLEVNTATIGRYNRKIPLRVALACDNEVRVEERLDLHICGQDRPAFILVEQGFDVIDATSVSNGDIPDKKINVDEPINLFLFNHSTRAPIVQDEDKENIGLVELEMGGIWKPNKRINVFEKPSGQVTLTFDFDNLATVVCFEGGDIEKGEFTLEDELRVLLSNPETSEVRLKKILSCFDKIDSESYSSLGGFDERARHRLFLSRVVTTPTGLYPVLTNLLKVDHEISGSLGNFVNYLGQVKDEDFERLVIPNEALVLLQAYSRSREAILEEVTSYGSLESSLSDHPLYATNPFFVNERSNEMERLIFEFIQAYGNIIDYIHEHNDDLNWHQLFVLVYLDCFVDWDERREKNLFFLLGPWHPLVIAKRFMIQSALYSRAQRLLQGGSEGKEFRQLSALLGRVQGFKWCISLSTRDKKIEPAFVSTTTDPGWHVAFKTINSVLAPRDETVGSPEISRALYENLGLTTSPMIGGSQDLPTMALSNYMNCFPSHRSIGVRICRGYVSAEVVKKMDFFLHGEDGPTEKGFELPGGVRLYLQDPIQGNLDAKWTDPPFFIYNYPNDAECISINNPDIFMSQPSSDITYRNGEQYYDLPRGEGFQSVFYEPLRWLTDGPSHIPDSVTYEFDTQTGSAGDLGGAFKAALGKLQFFLRYPYEKISSVSLPDHLKAPWVVIPGQSIDPAILVKYVCDSATRSITERALWDYKLGIDGQSTSFFILSTIPRSFQVSVNGFFNREDLAGQFILELGRIGIAIGGEALKSGRRALGIIGLVGAIRLLTGDYLLRSSISNREEGTGFLIPVDSFESFFGKTGSSFGKRSDILAVQIFLPTSSSTKMRISACGIEAKFVSGTFTRDRVTDALEQSQSTTLEFKKLVVTSLGIGAMPERLALLELVRFGLRISSQYMQTESDARVELEKNIYQCILKGNYEYFSPSHEAILVSTEAGLQGMAEPIVLQGGLWIRLTKTCWPGIAETSQFSDISQVLSTLFGPVEQHGVIEDVTTTCQGASDEEGEISAIGDVTNQIAVLESGQDSRPLEASTLEENDERLRLRKFFIGVDEARVAKYFDPQSPVDPLDNMNMMVTGSSGTGKTQFLKYLICKFREQNKSILVLDFKNDFASDNKFTTRARLERIFVNFDGLPYNPLIPYPIRHPVTGDLYIQPGQHIAGVTSVFRRTFRLGDQQAAALKSAMASAFVSAGLDATGTIPYVDNGRFPDFSLVGEILEHDNERAYNRLEPLFSLGLFKPECASNSFHNLTDRSLVIDLSMIPSEEIKNALAQLVVMSAHAYFNSIPHSGSIRQLFVIDEAFRVLDYEAMADFVLQCRAYGVGMLLSSQYPSQFPIDVSSSLATKVIHGNGRDSNRIRDIVQLIRCEGREGDIAGLDRFQAFIDNRHQPHTLIRTMNYPLYLVWDKLQELGTATREELSQVDGFNPSMLPIANLVQLLKRMGLAEEKDGTITVIGRVD